jgi:hypothetical protein
MSSALTLPAQGNYTWKSPVSTSSALPSLGNTLGDARVATDTSTIYIWTGITWQAVTGGGGGGAGFTTMQTPLGTSPVATGADTLTWTSTTIDITGNATTDTIALEIKDGAVTDAKVASGISGSKISGNITGNAANISATSNSTLTTLSSLSLPLTQTTGTLGETRGGTNQTSYAKGDILHATAANTLGKLGIGTQAQIPVVLAAGTLGYENLINLSTRCVAWGTDFIGGSTPGEMVAATSGTGSGSTLDTTQTAANPGVWRMTTGTTTTGWAYVSGNNSAQALFLGGGLTIFEVIVKLSAVSDGTDTYSSVLGVTNSQAGVPTNGIYFSYTHSTNGGNWTFNCLKASSTTSVDTGVAASTSAYQRLTWIMNSAGTSVQAYVNGVAAGAAITTNIPVAALQPVLNIVKTAGTTSRSVMLDAVSLQIFPAVIR